MSDDLEISLRSSGTDEHVRTKTRKASRTSEIFIAASVSDAIDRHVSGDTTVERGGVLVGKVDKRAHRIYVTGSIEAVGAISRVASLTFTHETWDHVNAVQEQQYPDTQMVGWYHSHPHFGVFLSEHDLFIHRSFFSQPWQIAYVVDPLLNQRGFFGWENREIVRYGAWYVAQDDPAGRQAPPNIPVRGDEPAPAAKPPRFGGSAGLVGLAVAALLVGLLAGFGIGRAGRSSAPTNPATAATLAPPPVQQPPQVVKTYWQAANAEGSTLPSPHEATVSAGEVGWGGNSPCPLKLSGVPRLLLADGPVALIATRSNVISVTRACHSSTLPLPSKHDDDIVAAGTGDDAVWVATRKTDDRWDLRENSLNGSAWSSVAQILPFSKVAVGGGAVWVTTPGGFVSRVDRGQLEPELQIPLDAEVSATTAPDTFAVVVGGTPTQYVRVGPTPTTTTTTLTRSTPSTSKK